MASHFDCVGFTVASNDAFADLVMQLAQAATRETGPGGTRLHWTDVSRAAFAIFVDERGSITCAKPTYTPRATIWARPTGTVPDPGGCPYCAIETVDVLERGESAYPLPVELDDWHLGPIDVATAPAAMYATAFAETMTVHADADAFAAAQADAPARLAPKSLIPSGLFSLGDAPHKMSARALITGEVQQAQLATNTLTGVQFQAARVETFAMTVDVVAAASAPPMAPGNIVTGQFWIVGARTSATTP